MSTRNATAKGAATALSTTYAAIELSTVPDSCELAWLHGAIASIASSASQVTWYLAADSSGDVPITDELLVDIVTGKTTATKGGVASALELDYALTASGTAGSLWLVAKTDAGTLTMTPELVFSEEL